MEATPHLSENIFFFSTESVKFANTGINKQTLA